MNKGWNDAEKVKPGYDMVYAQTKGGACLAHYREGKWLLPENYRGATVVAWHKLPERYVKPLTAEEKIEKIEEIIAKARYCEIEGSSFFNDVAEVVK